MLWKIAIAAVALLTVVVAQTGEGGPPAPGDEDGMSPPAQMEDGDGPPAPVADELYSILDAILASADHTILAQLVTEAGLADTVSTFTGTVFAPTDAAFQALGDETIAKLLDPTWSPLSMAVLLHHIIKDEVVLSSDLTLGMELVMADGESTNITSLDPAMINEANIITDITAANGVVHVIDSVLLPSSLLYNIVTAVASSPEFYSTFIQMVEAANFTEVFNGKGPFTIFAPTNEAFAALDAATVDFLTSPEGLDDLTDILLYHVYEGIVDSTDILAGLGNITMANGDTLMFTVEQTSNLAELAGNASDAVVSAAEAAYTILIGNATIVSLDTLVSNGYINAIDTVLLFPDDDEAVDTDVSKQPLEFSY